jgi:antitoxin YefM
MPRTLSKKRSRPAPGRGPMAMVEARRRLTTLPEVFEKHPEIGAVKVTRRGKPVLAVMSWDLYESITETLDIMSDPEMMAAFRQGVKDMAEGKVMPLEEFKRELGF